MKCISDTANTYMRIRKALGFREYEWEDNPHLFLHMGLSKTVWRKAVKRLVDCKVSRLKSVSMLETTYDSHLPLVQREHWTDAKHNQFNEYRRKTHRS